MYEIDNEADLVDWPDRTVFRAWVGCAGYADYAGRGSDRIRSTPGMWDKVRRSTRVARAL